MMKDDGTRSAVEESLAQGATLPVDAGAVAQDATLGARGTLPPPRGRAAAAGGIDHDALVAVDPVHYIVGDELARGGMGRILRARDRRLGRPVAIKVLRDDSGHARVRFEREARITARLQHPAIVNILEAGTWPGGEPFYAMKLVTGEPLDKVIAGRASVAERLGLLPTVIAVVDALAYAHSLRVIHRDLKPANVLVGAFGETVVIDWGLAKDLAADEPDGDGSAAPRPRPTDGAATEAGAVMGTPAYMPLEQAMGDAVDERADVYALGALLYHVLAGAPPYAGKTADATLAALIDGPPPPLAARAQGIPPDLITIVDKAMARDAADRYPSAQQLADDLKKFQTGQLVGAHPYTSWQLLRRWLRRHRTPVAVAAIAAVLLAALGVVSLRRILAEQRRTEHQRAAAVASRTDAEDLMSFMLVDLRDKLQPLNKLELLDDVAQKAIDYYDRKGTDLADADLAKLALARRNLGNVLVDQGHVDAAITQYRRSLTIATTLAAKSSANADLQADLASSHEKVGDAMLAHGDTSAALAAYRASLAIAETLSRNDPTSAERQRELATSHGKIGDVLFAQGDASAALAEHRAAGDIRARLAANAAGNSQDQRSLAATHEKIGNVLLAQADGPGALAEYRASIEIMEALTRTDASNAEWRRDLAVGHARAGEVLRAQGDGAQALAEFRAALAIFEDLAAKDPTNARRQQNLSVGHERTGNVLLAQGDAAGALAEFHASLAIRERLAAMDPANADRQRDLAVARSKVGDVSLVHGDQQAALAAYRASMSTFEALAAKDPTNADRRWELAVGHNQVGDVLFALKDVAGASAEYRASLDIAEKVAALDPSNAERQMVLAGGHEKMGDILLAQGNRASAQVEYEASLAINASLAERDPTSADLQRNLSISHEKVGDVARAARDYRTALGAYRSCLEIRVALAKKDSTSADRQQDLAVCHEKTGDSLLGDGDRTGAFAEYQTGLAIAQRLHAADPESETFGRLVATLTRKLTTCCGAHLARRPR